MGNASAGDQQLIERLLRGDEKAFAQLVQKHHGQLVRVARVFVRSEAVAQEVAQETWLAVIKGLPRFEGRSSLKTWIFRILTNRARSRGAREGRQVPFSSLDEEGSLPSVDPSRFTSRGRWKNPVEPWAGDAPETLVLNKEVRGLIEACIRELPPNQAAVVTLRDVQGWSSQEVCELLEVSEANQRVLLHRARSKLRTAIDAYFRGDT